MYYTKCPDDDLLKRLKHVASLNTRLCRLLLPIYRQELNIHGYQISTVTTDSCCGLRGLRRFTEFLCWKNMRGAYKLWVAIGLGLYVFNPHVVSFPPSRLPQNGYGITACDALYHECFKELLVAQENEP
jgi:hypothetical protein